MPADFDRDGDIDLLSISANPNYECSPEERFLLSLRSIENPDGAFTERFPVRNQID
jgi:hypothetical protein